MGELKVLILEDVPLDAELMEYEMRREGIEFLSSIVETEKDFIRELNDFKPDVILADHSLPHFDGVSALKITKKKSPHTPFIFVSGKIGNEFAVDMLKNGAKDYVFKNNLTKLAPAIKRAITERDELEELIISKNQLQEALDEKEMILKEIHHRVKNNLMIISNLLELQSYYIKDKADLNVFKDSKTRADSMALIHEKLYKSTDLKSIDFEEYIHSLALCIFDTYNIAPNRIKLVINVEDIMLDINTAIPLGLIINELLTNSLKYAFPEDKNGIITIIFSKTDDIFTLIIKDDGIGLKPSIDFKKTESLGLELVNNLTRQIDGNVELDNDNGTEFRISFKELEYKGII
jgi:two-component sensor histidine kinase/CheY-like chemotaxis protein